MGYWDKYEERKKKREEEENRAAEEAEKQTAEKDREAPSLSFWEQVEYDKLKKERGEPVTHAWETPAEESEEEDELTKTLTDRLAERGITVEMPSEKKQSAGSQTAQAQNAGKISLGDTARATDAAKGMFTDRLKSTATALETKRGEQAAKEEEERKNQTVRNPEWISSLRKKEDIEADLAAAKEEAKGAAAGGVASKIASTGLGLLEKAGLIRKNGGASVLDEMAEKSETAPARVKALEDELAERTWADYESLRNNADFAEKSKYKSTANGKETVYNPAGGYDSVAWDDPLYEFVNGNAEAGQILETEQEEAARANGLLGFLVPEKTYSYEQAAEMTDDERALYNYIYAKQGSQAAYEYLDWLRSDLYARQAEKEKAAAAAYAEEHPVLSTIATVGASPLRGAAYLGQTAQYLTEGTVDENAPYNRIAAIPAAERETVTKAVERRWGKPGTFAYGVGVSMAEFLLNSALTGAGASGVGEALSLVLMGSGAAADATVEAKERGLDDNQSYALGTIAGLAEILTEKISVENLFSGKWETAPLRYLIKNTIAEGSEEAASDLITWFADVLISRDKNEWQTAIERHMSEEGMDERSALIATMKEKGLELLLDAASGALSGFLMAVGPSAVGTAQRSADRSADIEAARTATKAVKDLSGGIRQAQTAQKPSGAAQGAETAEAALTLPTEEDDYRAKTSKARGGENTEAQFGTEPAVKTLTPTAEEAEKNGAVERALAEGNVTRATGIRYGADEKLIKKAENYSRMTGREVEFYLDRGKNGTIQNGFYDRKANKIYYNVAAKQPLQFTFGHEFGHTIEGTDEYRAFADHVKARTAEQGGDWQQMRAGVRSLYERAGIGTLTDEKIDTELVSDWIGNNLSDERTIREICRDNPSAAKRLRDALDNFIIRAGNLTGTMSPYEAGKMQNVLKLYDKYIGQVSAVAEPSTPLPRVAQVSADTQTVQPENGKIQAADDLYAQAEELYAAGEIDEDEYDRMTALADEMASTGRGIESSTVAEEAPEGRLGRAIDRALGRQYSVSAGKKAKPSKSERLAVRAAENENGSTIPSKPLSEYDAEARSRITEYLNAADEEIADFVEGVRDGREDMPPALDLGEVSERLGADIQRITGVDATGFKNEFPQDAVKHILKEHGPNGRENHSMRFVDDIARAKYIMANYDSAEPGKGSTKIRYPDGTYADTVVLSKKIDGTYYAVETVVNGRKKRLELSSAYIEKEARQVPDAASGGDIPGPDVRNGLASASEDSIAQEGEDVKGGKAYSISPEDESRIKQKVNDGERITARDEVQYSLSLDEEYQENAEKKNKTTGKVRALVLQQAGQARAEVKEKLESVKDTANLPPDIPGNTAQGNSAYGTSEENTTVCPRSMAIDSLSDAVADQLGRPLTVEESLYIAQEAFNFTDMPQCLYCYVAMDRMAKREYMGEYLNKRNGVIENLQSGMSVEDARNVFMQAETNNGKDPKNWTKAREKRFNDWVRDYQSGARTIQMSDLASNAAVERAMADPQLAKQVKDAMSYAQSASWAKKRVGYTAYNGHILNWKQSKIDMLNSMFGLRMYSFSDYSPAFVLENMQMVTDAAVRGLKMLAYTKDLDFVRIFAGTDMNINISTFGMDGTDGSAHQDAMQGADWAEAQRLREENPNVGITFVATNDNQVEWALDQDWIDVVIPFHMVKTGATVANIMGYRNYTGESSDRNALTQKKGEIYPNEHQNDRDKYFAALEAQGLEPRFKRWQDHPNYMKLVNETRRPAGDTPAVQPIFDAEAAKQSIDGMVRRGGYDVPIGGSLDVQAELAEEMADKISRGMAENLRIRNGIIVDETGQRKYSISEAEDEDYMAAVEAGDTETTQRMADEAARANGYKRAVFHGTGEYFNIFRRGPEGIHLGNREQAEQVAKTRFNDRSRRTKYSWDRIRQDIPGMNEEARRDLADQVYREQDYISWSDDYEAQYPYDGDLMDDEALTGYLDTIMNTIMEYTGEVNPSLFSRTYDRPTGENVMDLYAKINNPLYFNHDMMTWTPRNIAGALVTHQNGQTEYRGRYMDDVLDMSGWDIDLTDEEADELSRIAQSYKSDGDEYWDTIADILEAHGYDGIEYLNEAEGDQNSSSFIALRPSDVKSAAPVTYYDNGDIIPLSERFNPKNNDIRYSVSEAGETADMTQKAKTAALRIERQLTSDILQGIQRNLNPNSGEFRQFRAEVARPVIEQMLRGEQADVDAVLESTGIDIVGQAAARGAVNDALRRANGELARIRTAVQQSNARQRARDERNAELDAQIPDTTQGLVDLANRVKDAKKRWNTLKARTIMTEDDLATAHKIATGQMTEEEAYALYAYGIDDIVNMAQAERELREAEEPWARYTKRLSERRIETADRLLEDAHLWKDKEAGFFYDRETAIRNFRDIMGKDAPALIEEYLRNIGKAEAASTKFKNEYIKRVTDLKLDRKVRRGNAVSEAAAVQFLGEALDNVRVLETARAYNAVRDGKTLEEWRAEIEAFYAANPNLDYDKINRGIAEFQTIYAELIERMNNVLVENGYMPVNVRRGYFPHFNGGDDGILAKFAGMLGINVNAVGLPTSINGLTYSFKPGKTWFGHAQERTGFRTDYDAVQGFAGYIGGVSDVIHQTPNIRNLRTLASRVRYRFGDEGLKKQVDETNAREDIDETQKQVLIDDLYKNGKYKLANFAAWLDEYTNLLANKTPLMDRKLEQTIGRKRYNQLKSLEGRVAANMISGNLGSALTNFIPLTQAAAQLDQRVGDIYILRGMYDAVTGRARDDGFVRRSDFLTNRRGTDPLIQNAVDKIASVFSKPMEIIDNITSETIVRAAYAKNIRQGMDPDSAMQAADEFAADVMADRSKGAMPVIFSSRNPFTKLFTQFQLEVNNQFSEIFKDIPRGVHIPDKDKKNMVAVAAWTFLRYFIGAYLFNDLYEKLVGRRAALDPVALLNDAVGDFTGKKLNNVFDMLSEGVIDEGKPLNPSVALKNLRTNTLEELPFVGGIMGGGRVPISSAFPDWDHLENAIGNENWSTGKRVQTGLRELGGSVGTYILPPFAGGAVKKLVQTGINTYEGGRSIKDKEGNDQLQYPYFTDTPIDTVKTIAASALFGPTATEGGKDWVEGGFGNQSAKNTALYRELTQDLGENQRASWDFLQSLAQTDALGKRVAIAESNLSDEGKALAMERIMNTDKSTEGTKFRAAYHNGVSADVWAAMYRAMGKYDLNGNNKYTQAEIKPALDNITVPLSAGEGAAQGLMGGSTTERHLTNSEKAALWSAYDPTWKTKNNPYDPEIGERVVAEYNRLKGEGE